MLRPRYSSTRPVRRHYVPAAHGAIHCRIGGSGPVLVALHESPRSSLSLLPLIDALGDQYTVVAIDTPGYGHSAPLPEENPSAEAFARTYLAVFDALGIRRAPVYGTHTGAALALALARLAPERVTSLVLDGLLLVTPAERASFERDYLVPFEPRWDGTHVMQLWSRIKDLYTWFPWHERRPAARLGIDVEGIEPLHRSALGFLQSGRHYVKAYRRAADYPVVEALQALRLPITVLAREHDLIASHLARVPSAPTTRVLPPVSLETWAPRVVEAARRGDAGDARLAPLPVAGPDVAVPVGNGELHVIDHGPRDDAAVVLLPDLTDALPPLARTLADSRIAHRRVLIDLPGCGRSDPLDGDCTADAVGTVLRAALDQLGVARPVVVARGHALAYAERAVRHTSTHATELLAVGAPSWWTDGAPPPDGGLAPLAPTHTGAHLLLPWFELRDLWLYEDGWRAPMRRTATQHEAPLDVLQAQFVRWIEGPDAARLRAASRDPRLRRAGLRTDVRHLATLDDALAAADAQLSRRPAS